MTDKPDFEALRAARNAATEQWLKDLEAKGWRVAHLCALNDPNACYCDCGTKDPKGCEHDWTGESVEDEFSSSVTCARCGMSAMSHSLRCRP